MTKKHKYSKQEKLARLDKRINDCQERFIKLIRGSFQYNGYWGSITFMENRFGIWSPDKVPDSWKERIENVLREIVALKKKRKMIDKYKKGNSTKKYRKLTANEQDIKSIGHEINRLYMELSSLNYKGDSIVGCSKFLSIHNQISDAKSLREKLVNCQKSNNRIRQEFIDDLKGSKWIPNPHSWCYQCCIKVPVAGKENGVSKAARQAMKDVEEDRKKWVNHELNSGKSIRLEVKMADDWRDSLLKTSVEDRCDTNIVRQREMEGLLKEIKSIIDYFKSRKEKLMLKVPETDDLAPHSFPRKAAKWGVDVDIKGGIDNAVLNVLNKDSNKYHLKYTIQDLQQDIKGCEKLYKELEYSNKSLQNPPKFEYDWEIDYHLSVRIKRDELLKKYRTMVFSVYRKMLKWFPLDKIVIGDKCDVTTITFNYGGVQGDYIGKIGEFGVFKCSGFATLFLVRV